MRQNSLSQGASVAFEQEIKSRRAIAENRKKVSREENLMRVNRHKETNIYLRSVLREGSNGAIFFLKTTLDVQETQGRLGPPSRCDTSVKLTRLPVTFTKLYVT